MSRIDLFSPNHPISQLKARVNKARVRMVFSEGFGTLDLTSFVNVLTTISDRYGILCTDQNYRDVFEKIMSDPAKKKVFISELMAYVLNQTSRGRLYKADRFVLEHMRIDCKLPQKIRFLDAGCGFNFSENNAPTTLDTISFFGEWNVKVEAIGIDRLIPEKVAAAAAEPVRYIQADLRTFNFQDLGHFDYVRCFNVLYYYDLPMRENLIIRMRSALSSDGILIVNNDYGTRHYPPMQAAEC